MEKPIKIEGLAAFKKAMEQAPKIAVPIMDKAIKKSIFDIQRKTLPITPFDTGRLRGSFRTKFAPLKGRLYPTVKYAFIQHEAHFKHKVGQRKYLEVGVKKAEPIIRKNFEIAIKTIFSYIKTKVNIGRFKKFL